MNAANYCWATKSATTIFRALPGIMSTPTASASHGSYFLVSLPLLLVVIGCLQKYKSYSLNIYHIDLSLGMNIDRLYAIRRPLAYVNTVCMRAMLIKSHRYRYSHTDTVVQIQSYRYSHTDIQIEIQSSPGTAATGHHHTG